MKVSKEQIVGLIVALQNYTPEAVKTRQEMWEAMAEYFVKELSAEDTKTEKIVPNPEKHEYSAQGWPRVRLTFDEGKLDTTAAEVNRLLRDGNPAIYAEQSGNRITLNPQCLQAGEERIIVNRLRKILKRQ